MQKTKGSKNKQAIVYARVASVIQGSSTNSIDAQVQRCKEYAKSKGYKVEKVFTDITSGVGDAMSRKGFSALINYVDRSPRKHFVVIVDGVSAITRSIEDYAFLRGALNSRNIVIERRTSDPTPETQLVEVISAAFAQYERDAISRRVRAGLARKGLKAYAKIAKK